MGYKIAIIGATGNVGREMLNILDERGFPADTVVALASRRSQGTEVSFGDKTLKVQSLDNLRFHRHRYRLDVGRRGDFQDLVAQDRGAGLRRDRQLLGLALRRRRAADRSGSECRRGRGLPQAKHHRQPQLLDGTARRRAEAAARQGADQARGGFDLPVGLGRRQGRHGRIVQPDARDLRRRSARSQEVHQAHRLQRHSRTSTCSWTTARPRKSGRWSPRPRRSSTRRSR